MSRCGFKFFYRWEAPHKFRRGIPRELFQITAPEFQTEFPLLFNEFAREFPYGFQRDISRGYFHLS